jgi:RimJ/RimL family protein N-acetyltransferase
MHQYVGAALMRHLTHLARDSGIKELVAEVLPENIPMLKVFQKSGLDRDAEQTPRRGRRCDTSFANEVKRAC